jgi:hypothetical protein
MAIVIKLSSARWKFRHPIALALVRAFARGNPMNHWLLGATLAAVMCGPATAYNVFEYSGDPTHALKWGEGTDPNRIGTAGGIVTWSLMADGAGLDASTPAGISGESSLGSLMSMIDTAYGSGTALTLIQSAFDHWSAVANITFVQVQENAATPLAFSAPYSAVGSTIVGDIRIGAYAISGYSGAVGYAPAPNGGTTLEGDVLFNLNAAFQVAPGNQGDPFAVYQWPSPTNPGVQDGWYHNDFEGLFAHELGHALGLAHSTDPTALMCGYVDAGFDGSACAWNADANGLAPINRIPGADDVAGIQHLYGPVPEANALWLMVAGSPLLWMRRRASARRADTATL